MSYLDTVLAIRPANLIGYWPGDEASGTVARDASDNGRTGVYSGVTLAQPSFDDELTAVSYPGSAAYTDIYSASLAAAFNGQELSILVWFKVSSASVWSDGASRRLLTIQISSSNRVLFQKNASTGLSVFYTAGGTSKSISNPTAAYTGWTCLLQTVSKTANAHKLYINGVLYSTATGLGTWDGSLVSTNTVIGATGTTPTQVFSGLISNVAIFNAALTAADALVLAGPAVEEPAAEPAAAFTYCERPLEFAFRERSLDFTFRERT